MNVTIARAPKISVVIPCYNSAWSIGRTITSIIAQRFMDWEAIVIDDGSTDDLDNVLAPFLATEPRLRVIRQHNCGLAGARNRGIKESRSDLIAPIDADDIWHPDFLVETYAALAAEPRAPFAFAYSFRLLIDDTVLPFIRPVAAPRHDLIGLISRNSVSNGSAALFRKAALTAAGLYDEEMGKRQLHGAEDWKLALRMARQGTPALVERHLVGYRLVKSSMSQKNPLRQLHAVQAVLADMRGELSNIPRQVFRDGNTMITAWLLPAFAARREFGNFIRLAIAAYIGNPFWFRNPLLRQAHAQWGLGVLGALGRMTWQRPPLTALRDLELDGEKPFAFMPGGPLQTR